jgi:hypothetical protein
MSFSFKHSNQLIKNKIIIQNQNHISLNYVFSSFFTLNDFNYEDLIKTLLINFLYYFSSYLNLENYLDFTKFVNYPKSKFNVYFFFILPPMVLII